MARKQAREDAMDRTSIDTRGGRWASYRTDDKGNWVKMTSEEVEEARLEGERELKEKIERKGHDCSETPKSYEFWEDGRYYHGWECAICGDLIHTG